MRLRFIGILAALTMLTLLAAAPVAAATIHVTDHTLGEGFDNPCGSDTAVKINSGDILAGENTYTFEGLDVVLVLDATFDGGELDSVEVVSVTNGSAASIYVHAGEGTLLQLVAGTIIDPEHGISFVLFCIAPPSPTLSLEKVVTGTGASTTQAFSFTADGGTAFNVTADDPAKEVATTSGSHTIVEGALPANWSLTSITCDSDVAPDVDLTARTVTVTVGADEDVVCTFTNNLATVTAASPSLTLDKVVTSGDATLAFGFSLDGSAIAGLSANDAPRVISNTAGSHTVVEAAQSGWTLASVQCTDNATAEVLTTSPVNSGAILTGVTVTVGTDQDVTCTFTNSPLATLGGNPTPTPTPSPSAPVRQGTLASSVPNTAMDGAPTDQAPAAILGLLTLGSLAYIARRNVVASKHRS